jgi:amidophosphoribosyltransferase
MSGIFGVVSRSDCMDDLFYGTDYHSHLGTEFGGLVIQENRLHRAIHRIANGQFKNLFDGFYRAYSGTMGLGVVSDSDPQPIVMETKFGTCAVVTAGLIANCRSLARELIDQGITFSEIEEGQLSQTEVVAKIIARGDSVVDGIQRAFAKIEGSLSVMVMTREGVYAGSDGHARLPLAIGERDGTTAAAAGGDLI